MKIIRCLSEKIEDELHDADEYIDLAMQWKTDEPQAAQVFAELSQEEMNHVEKLHSAVAELINKYRAEHGDPPKEMMTLYEYLHRKHIADATKVKVKQGIFKA